MLSKSISSAVIALAAGACLFGCSNVITSYHPNCTNNSLCEEGVPAGLVYALPKGQILFAASRKQISASDLAAAQGKVAQANDKVLKDQQAVTDANKKGDADAIAAANATLSNDKLALDTANSQLKIIQDGQNKWQESATVTVLAPAPDPSARWVADLSHYDTRDDNLKLSVVNGLLTSATATSTDQTPNIIVNLANTAVNIATLIGTGIPIIPPSTIPATPSIKTAAATCSPYDFATIFNPVNKDEVKKIKDYLEQNLSSHIRLDVISEDINSKKIADDAKAIKGLVYRVPTPVIISTKATDDAMTQKICELQSPPAAQSLQAIVPDTRSEFVVRSDAGAFTTTNLNYGFANGMLTDYNVQHPSEIAAVANIPVSIVNSIMSIPGSILKLRLDYSSAETALVNAKTAAIQAQSNQSAAIINAQTAIDRAKTALTQAELGETSAFYNAQASIVTAQQALQKLLATQNNATITSK